MSIPVKVLCLEETLTATITLNIDEFTITSNPIKFV